MAQTDKPLVSFEERRFIWGTDNPRPRLLHLALNVHNLERSIRFYVDGLGMKLLDRISLPPGKMTAAFVGYGDYDQGGLIELCERWDDKGPFTHGTGFGHISVGTDNVDIAIERLLGLGGEVSVPARDYDGVGPRLAYLKDPDGYVIELIQTVQ